MKVVDWIDPYDEPPSPVPVDGRLADYPIYLECSGLPKPEIEKLYNEAREAVKREIREKGYRFSGLQHLDCPKCVPVLDNGMTWDVSVRSWARLMNEVWHPDDTDPYGYAKYFSEVPGGEVEKRPVGNQCQIVPQAGEQLTTIRRKRYVHA